MAFEMVMPHHVTQGICAAGGLPAQTAAINGSISAQSLPNGVNNDSYVFLEMIGSACMMAGVMDKPVHGGPVVCTRSARV